MTAAAALETGERARVVALLARAPAIGLSGPQTDMLVNALHKTTDVGRRCGRDQRGAAESVESKSGSREGELTGPLRLSTPVSGAEASS
jgi:hypothetical protein